MKLLNVNLEFFGTRSNIRLHELSDRLNVVFGPAGSGKSTLTSFIRWVLYGAQAGQEPVRFVHENTARANGSLLVKDSSGLTQTIRRRDDGSLHGHVSVSNEHSNYGTAIASRRLTGVDLDEFQNVFSVDFDSRLDATRLLEIANRHSFRSVQNEFHSRQIQDLEHRLAQQRADLNRLPYGEATSLYADRRDAIYREISDLERQKQQRYEQVERERRELTAEIDQRRGELHSVDGWLQKIDATIEQRRQQLDIAHRDAEAARQTWLESRRQKVEEIDYQIQQWHNVLDSIRTRCDSLRSRVQATEPNAQSLVDDDSDLRYFMRTLGYRVEDIEQDFITPYEWQGQTADYLTERDYLRSVMGTALSTMKADVARLSDRLRSYKASAQHSEYAQEIGQLRRCETELNELLQSLTQKRTALMSDQSVPVDAFPYSHPLYTTRVNSVDSGTNTAAVEPWYAPRDRVRSIEPERATWSFPHGVDPVLEARLQHLCYRRDQVLPRSRQLQMEIDQLETRLSHGGGHLATEDQRIDELRRQLVALEDQARAADQYHRLLDSVRVTESEIQRLRQTSTPNDFIQEASAIFRRLTCGVLPRLHVDGSHRVLAVDSTGLQIEFQRLDPTSRNQAYLALCLALAAAYKRKGVDHPVILSDLFVNIAADRSTATLDVLEDFVNHGHQLLMFTQNESIAQRLTDKQARRFNLHSGYIPQPPIASNPPVAPPPAPPQPTTLQDTSYEWVARWERPQTHVSGVHEVGPASQPPRREPVVSSPQLGLNSDLGLVPTLDVDLIRLFRNIGIATVGQFLEVHPDEMERQLISHQVTAKQVYRWQSELLLQVYVRISGIHSQILAECGIDDPEELSMSAADDLHRRILSYLSRADVHNRFVSVSAIDLQTVSRWIDAARSTNYRRRTEWWRQFSDRTTQAETKVVRVPRDDRPVVAPARVTEMPVRTVSRSTAPPASRSRKSQKSESNGDRKFYLELADPIVDAPSIGPKTAERFHAIGVNTVGEFLNIEPEATAEKINYRRITAEIINEWQLQTQLVYQIPNLRGHDAQILVACSVASAEDLSRADGSTLFKEVKRFCNTTEGKRILRNGKKPDLEEVSNWIEWAEHARSLQSA